MLGKRCSADIRSIQVVIGVKIYTRDFRVFWAHRRANPNHGIELQQTTEKLNVQVVTQEIFRHYIFFDVTANNIPPTPTPTLDLKLERIGNAIARYM